MANSVFDRDTLLDITVNIVPMVILAFFFVLYLLGSRYPYDPLISAVSLGLILLPFVLLGLLTYISALAIEG